MPKIKIEVESIIRCTCGHDLYQVSIVNCDKDDKDTDEITGILTTVTACNFCQNEARVQAYNKGLEYGRKSRED